jgi:hypothetical protein
MGGQEGEKGKLEPSVRTRGHLGAIIGLDISAYFELSKLARWTWQNSQSAD